MEESIPFIVFAVVVLAFAVLFLKAGIKIISQSDIYVIFGDDLLLGYIY